MSKSWAWSLSNMDAEVFHAAEEAAGRAGLRLEDWLNEAILDKASEIGAQDFAAARGLDVRAERPSRPFRDPEWNGRNQRLREQDAQSRLASTIERIERRVALGEQRAQRALESIALVLERTDADERRNRPARAAAEPIVARAPLEEPAEAPSVKPSPSAYNPELSSASAPAAVAEKLPTSLETALMQIAARRRELDARERALPAEEPPRESVETRDSPVEGAADKANGHPPAEPGMDALREQIAAMARAIAELAPRNAVVGLEGAVRDLSERVEELRRNGHAEQLLAPLDMMAGELRVALKAYDPQAAAAGLEREIRAIGGKIDGLAEAAVKPETFEAIRRQTEEVNSLLTTAANRTLPLDQLERRIGELADRIEKLAVSAAPQIESAQTAAALAELRREVERAAPANALAQIEQRLEQIAERLDEAVAPHVRERLDPKPFEDLARRIDGVREQVEKRTLPDLGTERLEASLKELTARLDRPPAPRARVVEDAVSPTPPIEPLLREISGKLDKLPQPIPAAAVIDMQPVEDALRALNARFDEGAGRIDRNLIDEVASETARRLADRGSSAAIDADLLARQIGDIHMRLDGLAALSPPDGEARWRAVTDELKQTLSALAAAPVEASNRLAIDLARMRSDQVNAERRTEANLTGLHEAIDTLVERLGVAEHAGEAAPAAPRREPKAVRAAPEPVLRGVEALNDGDRQEADALRDPTAPTDVGDFLLEPGSGAPPLGREARDLAHAIGGKTSPAISVHIAAARRAAQAAHGEGASSGDASAPQRAARIAARSAEFYATHKRSLLLAATVVVVAVAAFRLVGPHGPFHQSSDLGSPVKTAEIAPPTALPPAAPPTAALSPPDRPVDTTPTASIGPASQPKKDAAAPDLLAALPPGLPDPLRDGVIAGTPAAEYELALRLLEGRGAAQDQANAARWLERAAQTGLPSAEFRLGILYEKGLGVARNADTAEDWYRKAAEAGNVRAAHNLAVMAAQPAAGTPDYAEAVKWFRRAADMGVRDSQYNLAILYARGLGVDHDLSQSWFWFSLAASQGDPDAARKRDDVAAKLDPAALSSAAQMLSRFKAQKPDPAANDAPAPPPGGWDSRAAGPGGQTWVTPSPAPRVHTAP